MIFGLNKNTIQYNRNLGSFHVASSEILVVVEHILLWVSIRFLS